MMEASGSLEEQLEVLKRKAGEIRANKTQLRKIEEQGAMLERNLILDNRWAEFFGRCFDSPSCSIQQFRCFDSSCSLIHQTPMSLSCFKFF